MNIDNKKKLLRALVANNLACNTNLYGDSLRASEIAKSGEYFKTNVLATGNLIWSVPGLGSGCAAKYYDLLYCSAGIIVQLRVCLYL